MFKKILVPLDGSDLAAKILPYVVDLARTHNAQVTLLHTFYAGVSESFPEWIVEALEKEKENCEMFLARAAKDLEARD
jgi:nucleotide-binding universal stress UspA family protein